MPRKDAEDCIDNVIRAIQAGVIAVAQEVKGDDSAFMRSNEADFKKAAVDALLTTVSLAIRDARLQQDST